MNIPGEFRIESPIHYVKYLVDGKLREWNGAMTDVQSTISSTEQYKLTLLGSVPELGEAEALEALNAATKAYDKG